MYRRGLGIGSLRNSVSLKSAGRNGVYIVTFNLPDFAGIEQFGVEAITPGQFLDLLGDSS